MILLLTSRFILKGLARLPDENIVPIGEAVDAVLCRYFRPDSVDALR